MSYTQKLRENRGKAGVVLFRFQQQYKNNVKEIHVFVEGDHDIDFYMPILDKSYSGKVKMCPCNGKDAVVEVCNKMLQQESYDLKRCLFFVDRDIDNFVNRQYPSAPGFYITPSYSIENILAANDVLDFGISKYFRVFPGDVIFEACSLAFRLENNKFLRILAPLMALAIAAKRLGSRVCFSNFNLSDYIKIDQHGALKRSKHLLANFYKDCRINVKIPHNEYLKVLRDMRKFEIQSVIRGKFLLWFFIAYFNKLSETYRGHTNECGRKIKISVQLNHDNFFHLFAKKCEAPACLSALLDTLAIQ